MLAPRDFIRLGVKGRERPKRVHAIRPEDRRSGRTPANAFTRGPFCAGHLLATSGGQGLLAGAAPRGARRDEGVQEVLQEKFAPRLCLWFGVLVVVAFGESQRLSRIIQTGAKSGLQSKALRKTSEVRPACGHALSVSDHAAPEVNGVTVSLWMGGPGDTSCVKWADA